ncbi:MAG TPA: amylo-alpha-1,6-glucosidase [Longimicrobiales bacterium]|nr:amylo-alpha-1,6-glucosidase [Longimicrobiales bacterium]
MTPAVRRVAWKRGDEIDADTLVAMEWLVTNGLGGYASGTVPGVPTRRYHGLLIAGLPAPLGRTVMLTHLAEQITLPDGRSIRFGGHESVSAGLVLHGTGHLVEFRLDMGIPVWRYEVEDVTFEKRVFMAYQQNTVYVSYTLLSGPDAVRIDLEPAVHFRSHDSPVSEPLAEPYTFTAVEHAYEIRAAAELPALRFRLEGEETSFTVNPRRVQEVLYRVEQSRGYQARGELWSPGYGSAILNPARDATLVASTEEWDRVTALSPAAAFDAEIERRQRLLAIAPEPVRQSVGAELVLAADQFIITPAARPEDAARARAAGDDVRTVIAGYHWFTDWGRDTMISLDGVGLATGRYREAAYILRTFAAYVRDGLIPNVFPDHSRDGLYHTADASLWFFHALDRYVTVTDDRHTLERILPALLDVARHHVVGTRFGIGVDPNDGLLRQGAAGYQLTWMDAKVGDWVVTPRRGKAVEINALWYNALCLLSGWLEDAGRHEEAAEWSARARQAAESFNRRFWYDGGGYLYDVVDGESGDDPSFRPNQILALSLHHPVLARERWAAVLDAVHDRLLTPVGLRTLARDHPDYRPTYTGDIRARDAAYHQGTVWPWLIGPFIDAWLRVHPEDRTATHRFLEGLLIGLDSYGVGTLGEIFDAEPPYSPRGCIAQAWSVAETLRCWLRAQSEPS